MSTAIRIPLSLELSEMNSQLEQMRKKLKDVVKPDTEGYKRLERILKKAEQDMDKVTAASQKGFSNPKEIEAYRRQFESLVSGAESFWNVLKELDGSQFQLVDTAEIAAAKKEIYALSENLRFAERKKIGIIQNGKLGTRFDNNDIVKKAAEEVSIELTPEVNFETLKNKITSELNKITGDLNRSKRVERAVGDAKSKMSKTSTTKGEILTKLRDSSEPMSADKIRNALTSSFKNLPVEVIDSAIDKIGDGKGMSLSRLVDKIYSELNKALDEKAASQATVTTNLTSRQSLLASAQTEVGQAEVDMNSLDVSAMQNQIVALQQQVVELYRALIESKGILNEVDKNLQDAGKAGESGLGEIASGYKEINDEAEKARRLLNIKDSIKSWMGFSSVINIARDALSKAYEHIKTLDSVMTEIAVVTDMTQAQLWDQISAYSAIAQQYGATTEGVYQVSQLYYQQGLQTADVMKLTEETLKMAKIAGIEYKDATDYMTVAIRGFKMEMSDAQRVVDVYSHIAAITASDTEELAVAMSKTASSAEAVGSSFENTTAMIALMVNFLPLIIEKLY